MPTYEYACDKCSHQFEQFQSITDAALRKCPKCGKNALRRLISSGAALLFKGSGFYETDYRSESYKKAAEAESKPKTETPASDPKSAPAPATPAADAKPVESKKAPAPAEKASAAKRPKRGST